jgi:hypothetical protein
LVVSAKLLPEILILSTAYRFTFAVDRWGSLLTGLPCGIADNDIKTPWPQTVDVGQLSALFMGIGLTRKLLQDIIDQAHTNSVSSLYSSDPEISDRVSSPYYGYALKALALLDKASVKASSARTSLPAIAELSSQLINSFLDTMSPEVWAATHASIQNALARFAKEIETIRETTNVEDGTTLSLVHSKHRGFLVLACISFRLFSS